MDIPKDWTFKNKAVADEFDYHVREQLPWYDLATGLVAHLVRHYLPENGLLYDIGCSTGNLEMALGNLPLKRNARFIPIDNSEEMVDLYRGRYNVTIGNAQDIEYEPFDVAVCFLCLMFLSVDARKTLCAKLRDNVKKGGCIIVVDKTEMASGYLSTVLHRATIAGKVASGAPADEIVAKELSLAGIQRPLPPTFIERNFFYTPLEIFRFGEFAGWIYTKAEC